MLSSGPVGSYPLSSQPAVIADTLSNPGSTDQEITLTFVTDAAVNSGGGIGGDSLLEAALALTFSADAEIIVGTGGTTLPTKPTGWTQDTSVDGVWIEDNPV